MDKIYFAKIREDAIIPTREEYNAGLDIYPCFDEEYMIIEPGETKLVPTGIASAIPIDYYIQIHENKLTHLCLLRNMLRFGHLWQPNHYLKK